MSRSGWLMLFQNSVAWEKWSENEAALARTRWPDTSAARGQTLRTRRETDSRRQASSGCTGRSLGNGCCPNPSRWVVFTAELRPVDG